GPEARAHAEPRLFRALLPRRQQAPLLAVSGEDGQQSRHLGADGETFPPPARGGRTRGNLSLWRRSQPQPLRAALHPTGRHPGPRVRGDTQSPLPRTQGPPRGDTQSGEREPSNETQRTSQPPTEVCSELAEPASEPPPPLLVFPIVSRFS